MSVNIDDAHPAGSTGLIEAHLALTYDSTVFTVSAADVHLGSVLAAGSGWTVTATINPLTGQIAIALSSITPISSTLGGSLVTIDFHERPGEPGALATGGVTAPVANAPGSPGTIALAASVDPNGQYFATELADAQGTFTLTPAPTNAFDPRIDSVMLLAASPATVSSAAVSAPVVTTTGLVDVQNSDSPTPASQAVETLNPNTSSSVPEPMDQEIIVASSAPAGETAVHVSVATVHVTVGPLVSTSTGPLAAAPLSGLMFQLANTAVVSAQGSTELPAWQHVADQLFQALVRAPANSVDPSLAGSMRDTWERVLASQFLRSEPASDSLDGMNWDEAGSELDWQGLDNRSVRREITRVAPPATDAPVNAPRAALDQYFAQAADDVQEISDDE